MFPRLLDYRTSFKLTGDNAATAQLIARIATSRTTGPIEVSWEHRSGIYFERLTFAAPAAVGSDGRPTGTETISNLQTLSRTYTGIGSQVTHTDDSVSSGNQADASPTIGDDSLERVNVGRVTPKAFQYDTTGSAWTSSGSAGVASNGSGLTAGNTHAPAVNAFHYDYPLGP